MMYYLMALPFWPCNFDNALIIAIIIVKFYFSNFNAKGEIIIEYNGLRCVEFF
jgi:hypothetical protein